MSKQDDFEFSLDVEENIISLCCNCHKQIHLGHGFEGMLEALYNQRKDFLANAGIDIPLEDLISMYKGDSQNSTFVLYTKPSENDNSNDASSKMNVLGE